jgi:hypothetical protein
VSRTGVQVHQGQYDVSNPMLQGDEVLPDDDIGLHLTPNVLLDVDNTALLVQKGAYSLSSIG